MAFFLLNLYLKPPEDHLYERKFLRPGLPVDVSNKVAATTHKEQMDERLATGLTERIGGDGG